MSIDYTSLALIANVKRRTMTPTSQNTFLNTDFCGMLTDEMQSLLVPLIMELDSNYFLDHQDYAINGTDTSYLIPPRAINQTIKSLEVYNPQDGSYYRPPQVDSGQWGFQSLSNTTTSFWVENNSCIFNVAPVQTNAVVRMFYWRRPNNIVLPTQAGKITAIDLDNNTITVNNVGGAWDANTQFDIIQGGGGFRSLGDSLSVTSVSGYNLIFTSIPTGVSLGDWVAEAGESPIAQIPYEAQHVLCQAVAVKLLEAMSDTNMIKFSQQKLSELQTHLESVMKSRIQKQPLKIINKNGIFDYVRYRNGWFW
jgi:hypothetical protein